MSSGREKLGADVRGELARELRQFQGLSASFYRAAAARAGMTVTDLQVLDLLESAGPSTAGQLADLTGLTTGAITGMLNRLEDAGQVRRERDPSDGRRVIVRLAPSGTGGQASAVRQAALGKAWDDLALELDAAETAVILPFLRRCNTLAQAEILRLREGETVEPGIFSAPLGHLTGGRLVIDAGGSLLTVRADDALTALYLARFEGPAPEVAAKGGEVAIRYPRRLVVLGKPQRVADVALSIAVPWRIAIQAKGAMVTVQLARLDLRELTVEGGGSHMRVELPTVTTVVPVRLQGAASDITVRRPAGVAVRIHLHGWYSMLKLDGRSYTAGGADARLESAGFDATGPYYDIEARGATSMVTVTAG
ncbi:MAG TPA: MarR family transcriptional regulator [Chloroflexota bacterium]|nr:MarR family transcriptional regulator [Chloroflexota bacterium]